MADEEIMTPSVSAEVAASMARAGTAAELNARMAVAAANGRKGPVTSRRLRLEDGRVLLVRRNSVIIVFKYQDHESLVAAFLFL